MEEYINLLDLNSEEFDLADLKKAYRKKVLQYHPDKAANEAERIGFEATMKKLNEANAYIKEYLDNHEGRYSKSEYYNTNSYSDDDTEEDTTEDTTYSDEETEEESSYEEEENEKESEYYDEEETEEEQTEDTEEETIGLWEECVRAFKEGYNKNNSSTQPVQYSTDTKVFMVITILVIFISWLIFFHLDKEDSTPPPQQTTQQRNTQQTEQQEQQEQNKIVVIAKDSTLGKYIADAQEKTVYNWRLPKGKLPDSIRVKVAFRIAKDGEIIDYPTVKVSSGSSFVDMSCLRAVVNSAPFKPIPEELNKDYLDIELSFEADKKQ